jgi:alkylation response protein AidB-like acyl-CoA dehydrogenase
MNFDLPSQYDEFRLDVRKFLAVNLLPHIAAAERSGFRVSKEIQREWHRILYARGWAAPGWPTAHGGTGWTPMQRYIFEDECAAADAPDIAVNSLHLAGPVIYTFGSEEMKDRMLLPILRGDIFFCQGFSEPSAGSDLAHLHTRAIRDGDEYVIDGQKIWTSDAKVAEMMFALVRTDPSAKPQAGLSVVLIDMSAPGVDVRPIHTIDKDPHLNEVFFDHVRIPASNLVGEENKGWSYAKFLLINERTWVARIGQLKRGLVLLDNLVRETAHNRLAGDYWHRRAALGIDVAALEWSVLRVLLSEESAGAALAAASALKLRGSELQLQLSALEFEVLGAEGMPDYRETFGETLPRYVSAGAATRYLYRRANTILAGTNDIQRGLIWRTAFG